MSKLPCTDGLDTGPRRGSFFIQEMVAKVLDQFIALAFA